VKVVAAGLRRSALRLAAVRTARGTVGERERVVVTLRDAQGTTGRGEAAPLAGWSPETVDEVEAALHRALHIGDTPWQLPEEPSRLRDLVAERDLPPSAAHALEQALLDLLARRRGVSAARLLSPGARAAVPVHLLVQSPEEAAAARAAGWRALKVKVGFEPEADLARVAAIREAAGGLALRLDANGGWDRDQARWILPRLAGLAVACVEDPVAGLAGMAGLRGLGVAIAADAPIAEGGGLEAVIAAEAADIAVIKPTFVGGMGRALQIARRARAAGMGFYLTTVLGGALERAGALAVAAAAPEGLLACGLDPGGVLAAVEPAAGVVDGQMQVPSAPGFGRAA
jgi:o-succinylbenzoate synthase